jgi:hypothetical protein
MSIPLPYQYLTVTLPLLSINDRPPLLAVTYRYRPLLEKNLEKFSEQKFKQNKQKYMLREYLFHFLIIMDGF